MTTIEKIQELIGTVVDGKWGPKSQAALDAIASLNAIIRPGTNTVHSGKASSFADPADVAAFKRCKAKGKSDEECFKFGDNAIGCWGDKTGERTGPSCALPPEDMEEKWGSVAKARHKLVEVSTNGKTVTCVLKDRMPHRANIKNSAIIDLSPDAVRALGMEPPAMFSVSWRWV